MSVLRSARLTSALRQLITPRPLRCLHSTALRRATEVPQSPQNPLTDPTIKDFYDKVKNHQGAQDAMAEIGRIMEKKGRFPVGCWVSGLRYIGLDMTKPPSTMQMMKLGMDSEMRTAGMKVCSSL
jgi:hypothetical protein